jgi:hypothetical protein
MEKQEFRCQACGQTFTTNDDLDRHNKQMHPKMQNTQRPGENTGTSRTAGDTMEDDSFKKRDTSAPMGRDENTNKP